jgi:hypothetical protein
MILALIFYAITLNISLINALAADLRPGEPVELRSKEFFDELARPNTRQRAEMYFKGY